ncbi:niemann-Pick type C- protein 1 [Microbotryomycetes sp. JL221]|nr:niemann-Pick type C- protein 1 [Microbotryomycetes sp. JL221]
MVLLSLLMTISGLSLAVASFERQPGRCSMRGECGRKSAFSGPLPCPDNDPAEHHTDPIYLATLAQVCGPQFETTTCCTLQQLQTLTTSLQQAEPLIAPFIDTQTTTSSQTAVKTVEMNVANEFGQAFYDSCKDVKFGATNGYAMDLLGGSAKTWLAFLRYMGQERALGSPFQINYPAPPSLDLQSSLSSSSSSWTTVDDNSPPSNATVPFNDKALSCSDNDLDARCACPDCPDVCAILPPTKQRSSSSTCHVGKMSCFSFSLIIIYIIGLVSFTILVVIDETIKRRSLHSTNRQRKHSQAQETGWTRLRNRLSFRGWSANDDQDSTTTARYDRLPMDDPLEGDFDDSPVLLSSSNAAMTRPRSSTTSKSLVGATSLGSGSSNSKSPSRVTGNRPSSGGSGSDTTHSRTTMSVPATTTHRREFNPSSTTTTANHAMFDFESETSSNPFLQPRTYSLNTTLCQFFYKLGLFCSTRPFLTLSISFICCGLINIGWKQFKIEKDPVKLWVPKGSPAELAKTEFDQSFGPFYRTEQIIVSIDKKKQATAIKNNETSTIITNESVFSWETIQWWSKIEEEIRQLVSYENNFTLSDVCFSPTTEPNPPNQDGSSCIVQSFMGWFGNSLKQVNQNNWKDKLNECATTPAGCLPPSGQPLIPKLLLGGVPSNNNDDDDDNNLVLASQAQAFIVTYVVKNSLDPTTIKRAQEWESTLETYLDSISKQSNKPSNISISFSTGISLEQELNNSTNTDIPIVILSYLLMFLYVALNLGSSGIGIIKWFKRVLLLMSLSLIGLIKNITNHQSIDMDDTRRQIRLRSNSITPSLNDQISPRYKRQLLVDSKFLLGLWGIVIVLLSVSTSVALCSALGVKVTLIIAEVIPFLVLAIGVDNVFILSHELDQQNARAYSHRQAGPLSLDDEYNGLDVDDDDDEGLLLPAEERVARALGRVGPSILLSASCETVAFALGALVGTGAVLVNAVLQVTVFVSLMALDLRRVESNRVDCLPCLKVSTSPSFDSSPMVTEGFVAKIIRKYYAPTLLVKPMKYFVMVLFSGLFVLSWIGSRHIQLGLDQRLALPSSSYLINYFNDLDQYLEVGPPVYFVVKNVNFSSIDNVKTTCARFSTCDTLSMANLLEAERKRPQVSYLSEPPSVTHSIFDCADFVASTEQVQLTSSLEPPTFDCDKCRAVWIDDFFQWLNPVLEDCCRVKRRNPQEFCGPNDSELLCKPCFEDREPGWSITLEGMPEGREFMNLLHHWLESPTDESCPLGGKAGYATALSTTNSTIISSHFRTFHTPLKTQQDYIESYAAAERIAKEMSIGGAQVFPYSIHYVFFGSYAHLWSTTRQVIILALMAVFAVTTLLLGSIRTALVVILTVTLTVINVLGVMGIWNVSLNPLSLVNLVISIGISVEFCSHVARAFMGANGGGLPSSHPTAHKDRDERAKLALIDVGSSVVSGITITKLIGISVLALTRSKLLETYYFRMWLTLILSGALHGLVFLPVALSFFGGQGYALTAEDGDGSWIGNAVSYDDRGFLIDAEDDESNDSQDEALNRQFD